MFRADPVPNHRSCWKLLPWYVNGTLEAGERAGIERHLEGCDACRQEVTSLEQLRGHVRNPRDTAPIGAPAMARGLRQALDRIDGAGSRFRPSPAVRWVLAGQAAAILVLVSLLVSPTAPEEPGGYRTLSAPRATSESGEGIFRIVFSDNATEIELRQLLRSVNAEIVAGPSSVGAYTLRAGREPAGGGERLERLRASPLVRLVEPIRRR